MASSFLGEDMTQAPTSHSGTGVDSLGPSDSTDSGSDTIGTLSAEELGSDSDRYGTGVRGTVEADSGPAAADILPDHIERHSKSEDTVNEDDIDDDGSIDPAGSEDLGQVESIEVDVESDGDDAALDAKR